MVATTLAVSDVAVIGVNTEDTGSPGRDSITFILLAPIGSGTQIFFTDRAWNGTSFAGAGGDGTFTYTAGADLPAGTVITITQAQLTGVGINLSDAGETIYVYQGSNADTPTRFLHAVDIADGTAGFDGNELLNTGLVNGVSAVGISVDNAEFGTRTHNIQFDTLFAQINNNTDWVQNDNSPQDGTAGTHPVLTAPDSQLWIAGSGAGEGIVTINLDGTHGAGSLGYQIVHAFQNDANLFHPSDITLDTVHDRFFFVDADLNGNNRIVQGSISQLLNNPGAPLALTVLYSNTGTGATGSIRTLSIDPVSQQIYFDIGTTLNKINYNTANQTPDELLNLGSNNYITQLAIDYEHGTVLMGSSRVQAVFGVDQITRNYVYIATGLTAGSSSLSFSQLPFNPDDNDVDTWGGNHPVLSGEAWPVERGTIRGIDIDTVNQIAYIVTGTVAIDHDANPGTPSQIQYGGVYSYALTGNPAGNVTTLYQQNGVSGPLGLLYYIEVDPATGRYYVIDETGSNGLVDDGGVWTGSLTTPGTPTLVSYVGNINGLGPQGLEIQHAPTLTSTFVVSPTYTETAGADSPAGTPIILSTGHNSTDADSGAAALDQLAGAQVRISSGFQSGSEHQDVLTINGLTSGTIELGAQDIGFSYNSATGVMTFSGIQTLDQYEAALALVRFRTDGDNPTNYGYNTTRTISYSTFDGLLYSDEQHVTVTVVGVNDAPINVVPGAQAINEDNTRVFSTANGNALSVSDVDADPAAQLLQVTLSIADGRGTLTLASIAGLSFSVGDGAGDATMTFTGTANAINAALGTGLTFTPTADYNGAATLTFTVSDQGLNGTGGAQSDSDTVTINIAPVADIVNDSGTTDEDTAINVLVQGNDSFENPAHSITGFTQGANGTVTLSDNGTVADTTDDFLVYTANADFNGTDSFTYTITSGGVTETATVNVTVNAVADIVDDNATVDEDGTVDIPVLANDTFENTVHAITGFSLASNGTVTINNNGTVADATDDFLVYTPDPDFNGTDSFTYTVTSGGVTETATVNITVNAVNDGPDAVAAGGDYAATEQVVLDIKNSGLSLADVDSAAATVTVTLSVGYGVLAVNAGGSGVAVSGNITSTVTLTGTVSAINALLNSDATSAVSYLADGDAPPASTVLTLSINDNGNTGSGGALTDSAVKTINIAAVDDLPVAVADGPTVNADAPTDIAVVSNDTDVDGGPKSVLEINGMLVSVGIPLVLASGASVTLNPDGTIAYDPDGNFDYLVSPTTAAATGATNFSVTDSFTYALNGGSSTTVTVTVLGVDGPGDELWGTPGTNTITGTSGNDVIRAFKDDDTLAGGDGDDVIYGNDNNDQISGGEHEDMLFGGNGNDLLQGDAGNDTLFGNLGDDTMLGGLGDDTYYVGEIGDVVTEGLDEGIDTVRSQIDYTLTDNVENLFIGGAARNATGNGLDNVLHGSGSANTLSGLAGDDVLRGGGGRDVLLGGDGADLIDGGVGRDTLTGGADRDVFQFRDGDMGASRPLADVITDFSQADHEKIHLSLIDADTGTGGDQAFAFIGTGAFSGTAGELRYQVILGDTWISADTDGDGAADWYIGMTGAFTLTSADFTL